MWLSSSVSSPRPLSHWTEDTFCAYCRPWNHCTSAVHQSKKGTLESGSHGPATEAQWSRRTLPEGSEAAEMHQEVPARTPSGNCIPVTGDFYSCNKGADAEIPNNTRGNKTDAPTFSCLETDSHPQQRNDFTHYLEALRGNMAKLKKQMNSSALHSSPGRGPWWALKPTDCLSLFLCRPGQRPPPPFTLR